MSEENSTSVTFWSHSRFQGVHPTTIFMIFDICHKPKLEIIRWLQDRGLIASYHVCPTCKQRMTLKEESSEIDGYVWQCSTKTGKTHIVKVSIRRGTWFENSKFSLKNILLLSYFWYREYPHKTVLYEMQNISPRSILDWYNFCKGTCFDILLKSSPKVIGGYGIKIELYESKFWKRVHSDGHIVVNYWVFCGLQRDSTNCFLVSVADKTSTTMVDVIKQYVHPGTIIFSDIWKDSDYSDEFFSNFITTHELAFRDMETGGVGNETEGIWQMIKRQFPAAKRSKTLFDAFIGEFMYRRILDEAEDGYIHFLSDIAQVYTPITSDLTES